MNPLITLQSQNFSLQKTPLGNILLFLHAFLSKLPVLNTFYYFVIWFKFILFLSALPISKTLVSV